VFVEQISRLPKRCIYLKYKLQESSNHSGRCAASKLNTCRINDISAHSENTKQLHRCRIVGFMVIRLDRELMSVRSRVPLMFNELNILRYSYLDHKTKCITLNS